MIALLVVTGAVRAQVIDGEVTAVGFRCSWTSGAQYVMRAGQWVPVQVRLGVQGTQVFQGQLRVETRDLDGDFVAYRETPVTVTYDAPGKRAWCYAAWLGEFIGSGNPGTVDVLDADGGLLRRLEIPPVELIRNDTLLVLDISQNRLKILDGLRSSPTWRAMDEAPGERRFYRDVMVAAMAADELPDRWLGLEAVDVVVWDDPDPGLLSIAQLKALRQWVRHGGQLVIGLGASWPRLRGSELETLLPFRGRATERPGAAAMHATLEVASLRQFFERLARPGPTAFPAPLTLANVEAAPGALRSFRTQLPDGHVVDLFATHWLGSGRVIACAARLGDLAAVPVNEAFLAQILDLSPVTPAFRESEINTLQIVAGLNEPRSLYYSVVEAVSLPSWRGLLVLAAFAFVVTYIGVATLLSWWWLRRHRLTNLSWTVFAVVAVVASLLSLGTVAVMRGASRGVRSLALVDAAAGSRSARAKCYFGYVSPVRQSVDLSLAGESAFLRPLAAGRWRSTFYATPQRYSALAGTGVLQEAPMRATLKQFEGVWEGELDGPIRAELTVDRASGELTPGSWIQNDLEVDLRGGCLLYLDPRFPGDGAPRPAGPIRNWWGRADVPVSLNILAVPIGGLPTGRQVTNLGQAEYAAVAQARRRWETISDRKLHTWPDLATLRDAQEAWVGAARGRSALDGVDEIDRAALLASTRNSYLNCTAQNREDFNTCTPHRITTDGLMNLDVTHWLMQGRVKSGSATSADPLLGQAVLLLLADDAGPVRLWRKGRPMTAVGGRTLYRVRVPLSYRGEPPARPWGFEP